MFQVKMRCPNQTCSRQLQLHVKSQDSRSSFRCPSCSTKFAVGVRPQKPPAPPAEEVGTYGFARETSLSYLLQREQDGHKLSREEKADKKRLLQERLDADPDACPDCGGRLRRRDVECRQCGFSLETWRRPRVPYEPAAAAAAAAVIVVDEEAAAAAVGLVFEIITELL